MKPARIAAVVTLAYAAGFGLPTVPVGVYLLDRGALPEFMGLFPMYGGPWYDRFPHGTFVVLLVGFGAVTAIVAWSAWPVWNGSRAGAILNLALLPVEAVFWLGFSLPLPVVGGIARITLLALAWRSLRHRALGSVAP